MYYHFLFFATKLIFEFYHVFGFFKFSNVFGFSGNFLLPLKCKHIKENLKQTVQKLDNWHWITSNRHSLGINNLNSPYHKPFSHLDFKTLKFVSIEMIFPENEFVLIKTTCRFINFKYGDVVHHLVYLLPYIVNQVQFNVPDLPFAFKNLLYHL